MWLFDVLRVLLDLLVFIFFSSGLPSFRSLLPYRLALARHNRSWCLNTRSLNQSLWRLLPRIRTLQWVCFCFCRAGRKQQCQRIRDFWKFAYCMNSNQVFPRWIVFVGELSFHLSEFFTFRVKEITEERRGQLLNEHYFERCVRLIEMSIKRKCWFYHL